MIMKRKVLLTTLLSLFVFCVPILMEAQTITDVSKISPTIYERKVLYDCNGDGKLEYLSQPTTSSNWCWNDKDGKSVKEIPNTSAYVLTESDILIAEDLNNDEIPDLLLKGRTLALSTGNEYCFIDNLTEGTSADGHALYNVFVMDINHDGRKDFVGFLSGKDAQGYTTTYTPITLLQQSDNKFLYTPIQLSESPSNSSESVSSFTQRQSVPSIVPSFGNGMFVFDGDVETSLTTKYMASTNDVQLIDVNNDGFLDIIDSQKGFSMFSLSDGGYYPTFQDGMVNAVDLNKDELMDLVIFDRKNSQLLINIAQTDGTYKETKLLENGNITAVYCRDLDADCLSDILALAPTNSATFIVFFKNQGNGTFQKYERSLPYKGYYHFSEPCDLMNMGIPVLLFTNTVGEANQIGIVSWDKEFNVKEDACMSQSTQLYIGVNKTTKKPAFSKCIDFDGDSKLDIPSMLYSRSACVASIATQNNSAPLKMTVPLCLLDKATGKLRVNWDAATDKEHSSCDLTYEVRIGTTATKSDVALHNVERSCWCVINIGQQPVGNYYVSVRAIDPNGLKGAWSDCVVVNHTNPLADFIISKKAVESDNDYEYEKIGYKRDYYTTDVVVVKSLCGKDVLFTVSPNGQVLDTKDGVAQIIFNDMGTKTISMTTANGTIVQKQIEVKPFKVQKMKIKVGDYNNYAESNALFYVDLDADGKSEYINGNIKKWTGSQYSAIETLFNSDLNIGTPTFLTDKTRNGYPDIFKGIRKNGTAHNWLINNGNFDFDVNDEDIKDVQGNAISSITHAVDINNDGMIDFVNNGFTGGDIYINQGSGIYEKNTYELGIDHSGITLLLTDYDQDGLLDLLGAHTETIYAKTSYRSGLEERFCDVYHNEGNGNFSLIKKNIFLTKIETIPSYSTNHYNHHLFLQDVNGDGIEDLITCVTYWTGNVNVGTNSVEIVGDVKALLGSKSNPYIEELVLPGIPFNYDLNNDGKKDYNTCLATNGGHYADSLLISQGNQYVKVPTDVLFYTRDKDVSVQDVNNDNRPDFVTYSYNENYPYSLLSNYTNTAPTTPTHIMVSQTNDEIIVNWDAATDAESPSTQLRYNLSVKEKGAEGNGAYIISPMNATKDEAKVMDYGINHLRRATRYPIPISSFETGKTYEFCVQAVDPWMMHSPFSQKVEFTVSKTNLIKIPEVGGVGIPVAYTLNTVNGKTPTVTSPDAVMTDGTFTWSTSGIKTITAKAGTVTTKQQIKILDKPNLNVSIPEKVMTGSKITIKLPEVFRTIADKVKFEADENITISLQGDSVAIISMPNIAGTYPFVVVYQDSIFGVVKEVKDVTIVDARPTIVSVGNDNGKNKLKWDTSVVDASFVNKVRIYRESNLAGSYEMIVEVDAESGQYTDAGSNPDIQSYNYRMTYLTQDGIEGLPCPTCSTVFLMANKGGENDINLHWTPYEGAEVEKYTILMGTSTNNLVPIATVSGDRKSYLVERANNATAFFAIQYTMARNESSSFSNTINSDDAYDVIKANSLSIQCVEKEAVLNEDQMRIHLQAVVTPMSAHLADVAWHINDGEELATIDTHGVLCLKENNKGGVVTVEASTIDGSNVKATIDIDVADYQWAPSAFEGGGVYVNAIQNAEFKALQTENMPMLDMRNLSNPFAVVSFKAQTVGPVQIVKAKYRVYEVEKPMNSWSELNMINDGNDNWMSSSEDFWEKMLRMTEGQDYVLEFYYEGTSKTGDVFSYNNGGMNYHFMFNCVKPMPDYLKKTKTVTFGNSHITFEVNGVERSFDYEEDGTPNDIIDMGMIQSLVLNSYWNAWDSYGQEGLRYKIEEDGSGSKWISITPEKDVRYKKIDNRNFRQWYKENINLDLLDGLEIGKKYRLEISGESLVYNSNSYNDFYEDEFDCPFYVWKNGESSVFTFTIKDPSIIVPGDVTGNGSVNVQDATIVVNYILGTDINDEYDYSAADMNEDGEIDVFDVTKMIAVILSEESSAKMRKVTGVQESTIAEQLTMEHVTDGIALGIDSAERFTSFQMDVEVPNDVTLTEARLTNSETDHIVRYAKIGEKQYRVMALSMNSTPLKASANGVIELNLSNGGDVQIDNILFVTPQGKAVQFGALSDYIVTDIKSVEPSEADEIYDLSGRKMNVSRTQLPKGFYIINKKKVFIK